MQEDKQLKELLTKWAVQHPSAGFTSQVMQQVTSAYTSNANTPPLYKQRLLKIVFGLFVIVCIVLLILSFTTPATLLFRFNVKLPASYFSQGFSFLITFWIVMFLNLILKKYPVKTA
ncbi:hypothetical protein FC093_17680 [Ilyomonas limi]|uniref:Uncharacterized protein n=1 Tax=Ilyomonas limi TaxID=2575867 RepID=A0A4V5UV60_9BACT|nr:hypothetical protein [Ilyomonas limi]TKK66403.1 hypothetical protein FC093_17680 [Ilyomonas limi]